MQFTRRSFLAATAALTVPLHRSLAEAIPASGINAAALTNGFALGCQAWSFNRFTAFEAIEKTAASRAKCIELYPGQKLAGDSEAKVGPGMAQEDLLRLKAQLLKHNITATAFGVTGIPKDEAGAKGLFEFAKSLGLRCINTESTDAIDTAERMAKVYDIRVGYHNHPQNPKKPDYKVWDPNYILELVKGRDARIGACADTGHWVRSGLDPLECLSILKGRVVSAHFKDLKAKGDSHDVPWGTGISNAAGQLKALKAMGFDGPLSIEYEHLWENNLPAVTDCVNFLKNWKAE